MSTDQKGEGKSTFFALYYTWMLGIVEKVMVVSNMFQWLKEFLQVRLPLIK
jgi:hypothetical protein